MTDPIASCLTAAETDSAADEEEPHPAEFAAAADGWLAAYAKVHGAVVVTHEAYSPDVKRRVPLGNVCHEFNVPTWDTFRMLRELEVRFEWKSG